MMHFREVTGHQTGHSLTSPFAICKQPCFYSVCAYVDRRRDSNHKVGEGCKLMVSLNEQRVSECKHTELGGVGACSTGNIQNVDALKMLLRPFLGQNATSCYLVCAVPSVCCTSILYSEK